MTIDLQYTTSEPNRLNKQIINIIRLDGYLKNDSDVINPQIVIEGDINTISRSNYMTIYDFKRRYFIRDISLLRNNIYVISAHVDVLTSYASNIRTNNAIIKRQANRFNLYLDDGVIKTYQNPIIETHLFPNGFDGLMYVMPTIG